MNTIQQPITGNENYPNKNTPYYALVDFYNAFNNRLLGVMSNNWANTPDIAMDNPLGGIMRGWKDIKEVYQRLFNGEANVYVEYYDYTIHEQPDSFYTVGRERGFFQVGEQKIELAIRTSRIFQRINGEWQQVHHHGSIEDPELLNRYQSINKRK